jgi:hypothetical protein
MRILHIAAVILALGGCGRSEESGNDLRAAAEQSDPAAAAVLENAADSGADPQVALQQAGNAASLGENASSDGIVAQARPNLPGSPNRKDGTEPPDKVASPAP